MTTASASAGTPSPASSPETGGLDPAAALATIRTQRQAVVVRSDLILIAWGLAWAVGYVSLALGVGQAILGGCLMAAVVATAVVVTLGARGVRGTTSRTGSVYGATWLAAMGLVTILLGRAGTVLSDIGTEQAQELLNLLSSGIPCLVVGTIYMASAMLWEETAMAWTGAWILAVTALATIVGTPAAWWVMAVLGGGGLLAVGLVQLAMRKAVR